MRYSFEERFNIHIYCFDDLPQLKECIRTIPPDIRIYVFDGRYTDFEGDYDLTPGAEEWCGIRENVIYHKPPDSMLPFGKYGSSDYRYSQHEKGCWANYMILPPDQWTLQLDTDERLIRLNRKIFNDFEDDFRYRPTIPTDDGRSVTQPRIWKPKHWTLWIDDTAIPREFVSRDSPVDELYRLWSDNRGHKMEHLDEDDIFIENYGMSRPEEYNERRAKHLEEICRGWRAEKLRNQMENLDVPDDWSRVPKPQDGLG